MSPNAHRPGTTPFDWHDCIDQARKGAGDAVGWILEVCRPYLLRIANQELDTDLQAKVAPSDLVQETCLEAQRDFGQFRGSSEQELRAWLRQVLLHNLGHLRQRFATERRAVTREQALNSGESGEDALNRVPADTPSPSAQARANEEKALLKQAIARLPPDYRQVIILRHRDHQSFAEIGRQMGRTDDAAQKLWTRAIERLRREIVPRHES